MSRLTKTSLMVAFFLVLDKALAFVRLALVARYFGSSGQLNSLDAYNVANNIPDLLVALMSGGALAMAVTPVLSEILTKEGRSPAWRLFSQIGNLTFLVTGTISLLIALFAQPLVSLVLAPGFSPEKQALTADLMRINLFATLIFSISGLIISGLHANQHFFLPVLAPVMYNVGQIIGATVLGPSERVALGPILLPTLGLGVHGLLYGAILGSLLHLAIQIPGLLRFEFHWSPVLDLRSPGMVKLLRILAPRLVTMFFIQLIFLTRDSLASHLGEGSVTMLYYGWTIQQVPETIIGTALGIVLLPTLAEFFTRGENENFRQTVEKSTRVLVALTLPIMAILAFGLGPLVAFAFRFRDIPTESLMWVTRGFLLGLTGNCLIEVANRAFYARQQPWIPLIGSVLNFLLYVLLGNLLYRPLGVPGISLTDSLAFTIQSVILLLLLSRRIEYGIHPERSLNRAVLAALVGGALTAVVMVITNSSFVGSIAAMAAGTAAAIPFIWPELKLMLKL